MVKHVRLGPLAAIPKGEGRTFFIGGLRVAVFHTREGRVFATQAECPHRGGALADGVVGSTSVVCPLHEWTFDLRSGAALVGACSLRTYPVTQGSDGMLVLEVEEDGSQPPWRITDHAKRPLDPEDPMA
ncbi:MAG: Rieske (2Fe-2S) protein [Polyangiaceae bacterium]